MELFHKQVGQGKENLIILHGLYGSSDNWLSIAKYLEDIFTIYLLDQRNHGQSPHSDLMDYEIMAKDLNDFMDQQNISSAVILGHSMGGKTAMRFALMFPQKVDKLVVVDIAPKSYGTFSNYARITNDHQIIINALLHIDPRMFSSRSQIDHQLQKDIPNNMVRSFLLKNIGRNDDKTLLWKLNLKAISENLHHIMDGFSDLIVENTFPDKKHVFFIKGENSPYIMEEDMKEVRHFFPSAQLATIPNAGHWLHAEQTRLFIDTLLYFIE